MLWSCGKYLKGNGGVSRVSQMSDILESLGWCVLDATIDKNDHEMRRVWQTTRRDGFTMQALCDAIAASEYESVQDFFANVVRCLTDDGPPVAWHVRQAMELYMHVVAHDAEEINPLDSVSDSSVSDSAESESSANSVDSVAVPEVVLEYFKSCVADRLTPMRAYNTKLHAAMTRFTAACVHLTDHEIDPDVRRAIQTARRAGVEAVARERIPTDTMADARVCALISRAMTTIVDDLVTCSTQDEDGF